VIASRQAIALVVSASVALHVVIALGVTSIRKPKEKKTPTAIAVRETKKKPPKPSEPPPPPPPPPPDLAAAPKKTAPKPAAKAPDTPAAPQVAAAAPVAEFAGNFSNLGSGGGTLAVPQPVSPAAKTALGAPPPPPQPKVLTAGKADVCNEPPSKPKPVKVLQPAYTEAARTANVEGRVRVEITVDENGRVTNARVLQGLGHGLDEAALAAARASTFTAGTHCGRPVSSTFVIGMRFSL
jgi:protein TonB